MRALVGFGLVLFFGACDPGSTGPDPSEYVGRYALRTVDGVPVPAVVFEEEQRRIELLSGAVTFYEDRRAENEYTYRITDANGSRTPIIDDAGTYTVTASTIVVTWESGLSETYTRADSAVSVFDGALHLAFHK